MQTNKRVNDLADKLLIIFSIKNLSLVLIVLVLYACSSSDSGKTGSNTSPPAQILIANNDVLEVTENSILGNTTYGGPERILDVLLNDEVSNLSTTKIVSVISPTLEGGAVAIDAIKKVLVYIPPDSLPGPASDEFNYTIQDSDGNSSTANVKVLIGSTLCALENILCVGSGEEYDTDNPDPETALANAVANAQPGYSITIRGGNYKHTKNTRTFMNIDISGTALQPIIVEPYFDEVVRFQGWGFTEGVVPTRDAEVIIQVTGDYIHIKGIEVSDSTRYGIDLSGNYGRLENVIGHDCWWSNLVIGAIGGRISNNNVISGVESYRSRHGGGIMLTRRSTDIQDAANNVIENSISYNNGYQPSGVKVPGVPGDPSGGGNSDGIVVGKDCNDRAVLLGVDSICPNTIIRNNVTWHNADDGIDNPLSVNAVIADNISFDAGTEGGNGFKGLRYVTGGVMYIGNISLSNYKNGFEPRMEVEGYMYHNLAAQHTRNTGFGMNVIIQNAIPATAKVYNNLVFNNNRQIIVKEPTNTDQKTNWTDSASGQVANPNFSADAVNTTFPEGLTIEQKAEFIRDQFKAAFMPVSGSVLLDAGTLVPNIHCDTADDDLEKPMDLAADCRHWLGMAPDIGPYEAE